MTPISMEAAGLALDALLARLCGQHGFARVSADELAGFAAGSDSVTLLLDEPQRVPESFDLAVILPEILKSLPGRLRPAVAEPVASRALMQAYGVTRLPALLFQRDGAYLGVLEGLLDWAAYVPAVEAILARQASRAPGIGIPVLAASSGCH